MKKIKIFTLSFGIIILAFGTYVGASGLAQAQIAAALGKAKQKFISLGQNEVVISSTSIANGKKAEDVFAAGEFNRVLEILLETKTPIGQGCDSGSFVVGFEDSGKLRCYNGVSVVIKDVNTDHKEFVRSKMRKRDVLLPTFGTGEKTDAIESGKEVGGTLSAKEFNKILEISEYNLKLLGRACPINTAIVDVLPTGNLVCKGIDGPVFYPVYDNAGIIKNKFTNIPLDKKFTLLGDSDNDIDVGEFTKGKVLSEEVSSGEFNRFLELLIVSENMIGDSCSVGKFVAGFDNDGNIICEYLYKWTTGNWSTTCGNAYRSVQCERSDNAIVEEGFCTTPKPSVNSNQGSSTCGWSGWSWPSWGSCSRECGGGTMYRTGSRTCQVAGKCAGPSTREDSRGCNFQNCPIVGNYRHCDNGGDGDWRNRIPNPPCSAGFRQVACPSWASDYKGVCIANHNVFNANAGGPTVGDDEACFGMCQ